MLDGGESTGLVFLEGLHLHRAMLGFQPLVHHALQRFFFLPKPFFHQFVLQSIYIHFFFPKLLFTADESC